jgi:hypothetical protein
MLCQIIVSAHLFEDRPKASNWHWQEWPIFVLGRQLKCFLVTSTSGQSKLFSEIDLNDSKIAKTCSYSVTFSINKKPLRKRVLFNVLTKKVHSKQFLLYLFITVESLIKEPIIKGLDKQSRLQLNWLDLVLD